MGYQFIHIEAYARSASKMAGAKRAKKGAIRESDGNRKNWSAREILAEALREDGACGHVTSPQAPEVLMGNIAQLAHDLDISEPPKGQRKDTPIMLAGVISAPWPPSDDRSIEWRMDCLTYLTKTFGKDLDTVIAHNDENYDHLHFYIRTPKFSPVKPLHPGFMARAAVTAEGGDGKAQTKAFNTAMSAFQDDYYRQVAATHGQTRLGPKRQRVGRMEWLDQKRVAELASEQAKEQAKKLKELEAIKAELVAQATLQRQEKRQLQLAQKDIDARSVAIQENETQAETKLLLLTDLLGRFSKTMLSMFTRLSWTEKDSIKPLMADVDRIKVDLEEAMEARQKAKKTGLHI